MIRTLRDQQNRSLITDPARFRAHFPAVVSGDVVHLASCRAATLSIETEAALAAVADSLRGPGDPWTLWLDQVNLAKTRFAAVIGARVDQIAVLSSATEAAYQVASTRRWARRPALTCTDAEFPSLGQVWLAQRARGAQVRHVLARGGLVELAELVAAVDERCGLVSVPMVASLGGGRLPVAEAIAHARQVGAPTLVDAYQAAGVTPIDVRELGCDFLIAGAAKFMLGCLPGMVFLYVRDGADGRELLPQLTGWFGRRSPMTSGPRTLDTAPGARRFEVGTPAACAAACAAAGLGLVARLDLAQVQAHVGELATELHLRLDDIGEQVVSPATARLRGPQVAILDEDPAAMARWLAAQGIATSPRGSLLRMALHFYNNRDDVDRLAAAVLHYRSVIHNGQ